MANDDAEQDEDGPAQPDLEALLNEACAGDRSLVLVDETGKFPDPRQVENDNDTFATVAVLLTRATAEAAIRTLDAATGDLRADFGATGFHFSDFFGGRKEFEHVPQATRLDYLRGFANMFGALDLCVVVANPDLSFYEMNSQQLTLSNAPIDVQNFYSKRPGANLLLLGWAIFFGPDAHADRPTTMVCDRFMNARVGSLGSDEPDRSFVGQLDPPKVYFENSSLFFPLQLADFAAWAYSRLLRLRRRLEGGTLTDWDRATLEVLEPMCERYSRVDPTTPIP